MVFSEFNRLDFNAKAEDSIDLNNYFDYSSKVFQLEGCNKSVGVVDKTWLNSY